MCSSGSYRDELLCIAMHVFFRSDGWTYITERSREAISTVLPARAILHASSRKEAKSRTHCKSEIRRRPGQGNKTGREQGASEKKARTERWEQDVKRRNGQRRKSSHF